MFGAVEQVRRGGLLRLRGDQQSDPAMSNILKTIDLTDHAIRRAVFAVLDGLAALLALSVGNSTPNSRNDDAARHPQKSDPDHRQRGAASHIFPSEPVVFDMLSGRLFECATSWAVP
jgi:hypothetical protein